MKIRLSYKGLFFGTLFFAIACIACIIFLSTGNDWQQEYDALKAKTVKDMEFKNMLIEQGKVEIKDLNVEIEKGKVIIEDKESKIIVQNKNLEGLEATEHELAQKEETLEVVKLQRDNYKQQVAIWKNKFNLSQDMNKQKDEMIFSLNKKYDAQFEITLQWESKYENLGNLLINGEKVMGKQAVRIKVLEAKSSIFKLVKIGVVAGVIYGVASIFFRKK